MASDIDSPHPSHLGSDTDFELDHLPLTERRRRLLRLAPAPAPARCEASAAADASGEASQQSWPGLPRGVEFNPSDSDLLWHLAAEVGNDLSRRHPFINEFIKSVGEDEGLSCTHPQNISGVRQDGRASYFFHKKIKLCDNENNNCISWQKCGTPRSIILDGSLRGCKEVFVLYAYNINGVNPERTDWRLHQYHIKSTMKDEGDLAVSKLFLMSQKYSCDLAGKAPIESVQDEYATNNDSKDDKENVQLENYSDGNNHKQLQIEMYPEEIIPSSCKDILDTTHMNDKKQINDQAEAELDHISLQERYRILLPEKHSCSAWVSLEDSCRQMGGEISGNDEETAFKEDTCSMLQEFSSAPSILDSTDVGTQISSAECLVDSNANRAYNSPGSSIPNSTQGTGDSNFSSISCPAVPSTCQVHDPIEHTEDPVNDRTLNTSAEMPARQTPTCGNENVQLAVRNPGTDLVDVKMEPALEGCEIYSSESFVKFHCSRNGDAENMGSVSEYLSKGRQTKGPLSSLGVKTELTGSELPDLCTNKSINMVEPTAKTTRTRILNHDGGLAHCSRQRQKRKMATNSSENVLEEDAYKDDEGFADRAYKDDEGFAYRSRRRKKKKTATDSVETALEEDAPGLLEILLDKGIMVKEIKLYGVEEDDEMVPDCAESDFQDLENVIKNLFSQRASLLKSAARHAKGEKKIYCLACLISLIEQSRYLQFRDCPVEWGWCRDLQSFIFIFRSHNRLVLERPEYGYATYFFEIAQLLPIEWQIRRLVTAMKLSNCGRTALIENRPLLIGEDLSEGEAQVLEGYGWIRNTGLGTMLNYRDRVVHDRWNEKCSTDWRMKIGKLLMNGYCEGQLMTTHIPEKIGTLSEDTEIKLEDAF